MRRLLVPLLVALGLVAGSLATTADGRPRGRVAERDRAERVKKKIRKLRAVILVDELDLDETTAAKLFPILDKYDAEFARLAKENLRLRRDAEAAADGGDDDALEDAIDALVANQRARWDLDEKRFAEVRKVLTPRQAARILVVLPEIDRRILEGARRAAGKAKANGKRKGKGKRGRRNAPDPDELDDE